MSSPAAKKLTSKQKYGAITLLWMMLDRKKLSRLLRLKPIKKHTISLAITLTKPHLLNQYSLKKVRNFYFYLNRTAAMLLSNE